MAKEPVKVKTKLYTLVGRSHEGFDEDGMTKTFVTGDKVALTDSQFEAFKDKFDSKGKEEDKIESPTKPESNVNPENKNIQPVAGSTSTAPGTQTKTV